MNIQNFYVGVVLSLFAGLITLYSPDFFNIRSAKIFVFYTFTLALIFGAAIGWIWGSKSIFLTVIFGLAYPIKILFDLLMDPTSHNLWPIEILFCLPYIAIAMFGSRCTLRKS